MASQGILQGHHVASQNTMWHCRCRTASQTIAWHRRTSHHGAHTNKHTHTSTLRFTAIHCDPHIMTVHPGHTQGVCQRHQRERYYTKATPCDTIGIYTSYECSSNNSTPSNSSTLQQYLPCDSAVH